MMEIRCGIRQRRLRLCCCCGIQLRHQTRLPAGRSCCCRLPLVAASIAVA